MSGVLARRSHRPAACFPASISFLLLCLLAGLNVSYAQLPRLTNLQTNGGNLVSAFSPSTFNYIAGTTEAVATFQAYATLTNTSGGAAMRSRATTGGATSGWSAMPMVRKEDNENETEKNNASDGKMEQKP
jgi:hypothetical protein